MSNPDQKYKETLITRFKSGQASEDELMALFTLLKANEIDTLLSEDMDHEIQALLHAKDDKGSIARPSLSKYLAAASILIFLGFTVYFLSIRTRAPEQSKYFVKHDARPGSNKAVLTLANGRKINLDDALKGKLASENGAQINKDKEGQLVYQQVGPANPEAFNTITTPRGGQWQVVLPDGSHVWLNAESSLTYPISFKENAREVEMTGEAYFEIAKKMNGEKRVPFMVHTAGAGEGASTQTVEVLGTHFNINAYPEEQGTKTTLLEGSVKLRAANSLEYVFLKPGQRASLRAGKFTVGAANTSQAVGWKNGDFVFDDQDFKTTMRQIARWYDMEVRYDGAPENLKIGGDVSRANKLSAVLQAIELTGKVKFKTDGKKIIVTR